MRKEAFSKYVKRLALLTVHQRGMLAQALAASQAGAVSEQLGEIAERPAGRIARQSATACIPGGRATACRATAVTPAAEPATR